MIGQSDVGDANSLCDHSSLAGLRQIQDDRLTAVLKLSLVRERPPPTITNTARQCFMGGNLQLISRLRHLHPIG